MAQNNGNRLVDRLRRFVSRPVVSNIDRTNLDSNAPDSISSKEESAIIGRISSLLDQPGKGTGKDAFKNYIQPLARQIAATKLDAEAIERLAPEVKKAREIVIPSIINPTTYQEGSVIINSTSSKLTDQQNKEISDMLDKHFGIDCGMVNKLPNWLTEVLYGAGAKPLMVVPVTELDTIINDPSAILSKIAQPSNESIHYQTLLSQDDLPSLFDMADPIRSSKTNTKPYGEQEDCKAAVETAVMQYMQENELAVKDNDEPYNFAKRWTSSELNVRRFANGAIENIKIVDNPDVLKGDKARKSVKQAEIKQKFTVNYKTTDIITLNLETKPSVTHPVVYELPPESVIPIFTPGSPSDHIGYFVLLDEFGNPLSYEADGPSVDMADNKQVNAASLYKSFGFGSEKPEQMQDQQKSLSSGIYQQIVESYLKNRLKTQGFNNTYIGAPSSVYKFMFSRYLSARKTKMLFVPRDMMTYFCFRHNSDGTGRSKIEDIKFVLSLKITLLICRVMAAQEASINRKKINVQFSENMGDPIAYIEMIKKEVIDKSMTSFSYDPSDIVRSLAQKGLTVAAKGIPGAENFEISTEANPTTSIKPDDSLAEDIDNMMIMGLDVPASAYNMLGENEFSRSVVSNNILFSRHISEYQRKTCDAMRTHVQQYIGMSGPLQQNIKTIIQAKDKTNKGEASTEVKKTEMVTDPEYSTGEDSQDELLRHVISHITTTLPKCNVSPSKTEFEELNTIVAALTTTLEAMFENDLGDNGDNPMVAIRAFMKTSVIQSYMDKLGMLQDIDIPNMDSTLVDRLVTFKIKLANMSKGIKDGLSKTTVDPTATPDPNAGSPPF